MVQTIESDIAERYDGLGSRGIAHRQCEYRQIGPDGDGQALRPGDQPLDAAALIEGDVQGGAGERRSHRRRGGPGHKRE